MLKFENLWLSLLTSLILLYPYFGKLVIDKAFLFEKLMQSEIKIFHNKCWISVKGSLNSSLATCWNYWLVTNHSLQVTGCRTSAFQSGGITLQNIIQMRAKKKHRQLTSRIKIHYSYNTCSSQKDSHTQ